MISVVGVLYLLMPGGFSKALIRRDVLILYGVLVCILVSSVLLFEYTGLSRDPLFFRWAILYYGSAVVQAYATIIAVPFTIWVIYMQSRYGYIMVKLFINRVILPFTILVVISIITSLTMSYSETQYAYSAFFIEYAASLLLLPPIIYYIRELMTMNPENLVRALLRTYREPGEALASIFHILRLVLIEAYPEERVINNILRIAQKELEKTEELRLNPDTFHRFRDLIRAIVVEATYLPDMRTMRDVMKNMLKWAVAKNRVSIARALMRYYVRVAMRYLDEYLPALSVYNLYIDPVILSLKSLKARRSLLGYSIEQLATLLNRVKSLGVRGDISAYEICYLADTVEKNTGDLSDLREYEKLHRVVSEVRAEFMCVKPGTGKKSGAEKT